MRVALAAAGHWPPEVPLKATGPLTLVRRKPFERELALLRAAVPEVTEEELAATVRAWLVLPARTRDLYLESMQGFVAELRQLRESAGSEAASPAGAGLAELLEAVRRRRDPKLRHDLGRLFRIHAGAGPGARELLQVTLELLVREMEGRAAATPRQSEEAGEP